VNGVRPTSDPLEKLSPGSASSHFFRRHVAILIANHRKLVFCLANLITMVMQGQRRCQVARALKLLQIARAWSPTNPDFAMMKKKSDPIRRSENLPWKLVLFTKVKTQFLNKPAAAIFCWSVEHLPELFPCIAWSKRPRNHSGETAWWSCRRT
jgi:hypothetical protein